MDRLRLASSLRPFRAGFRAGLPAGLIAAALALFAAGGLRAAEPPTAFDLYLERGYTELAIYAATIAEDLAKEDHFIGKARAASDGQAVAPEQPTDALPPDMIDEALALRHGLATALGRGVAAREPLLAARAQVNFDCWLAQFPATEASEGSGDCRRQLQHTLALLDATATDPAVGPPADDVAPPADAMPADGATADAGTMDAATREAMPAEPGEPSAEPAAPTAEPATTSDAELAVSGAEPLSGNADASAPVGSDAAPAPGTLISVVIVGLPPGTPGADTTDADRRDSDERHAPKADALPEEPAAGGTPDGEIAEAAPPRTVSQPDFGQGGFGYELRSEDRTVVGVSALAAVIGPIGGLRAAPAAGLAGASVEDETEGPGTPEDAADESSGIHGVLSGIVDGIAGAFRNGSEEAGDSGSSDGTSADSSSGSASGGDASSGSGGLGGTVDGAVGGIGDAVGGLGDAAGGAVDGFGGKRSD